MTELDNGLRIVTEQIPGARSTSIGILVDASPQHDPIEKLGLAHFVEHGLFQGTTSRDAREISAFMDEAGGQMGAFTSRDYTCFFAHIMDDYSPFAWELLGDILLNSTFPVAAIARERDVVLHELAMENDDHASRIHDALKERIWGDHPLSRRVGGKVETVQQLTRDDVLQFVAHRYTADRMIVAAAGAAPHDRVVEQAQDAFWQLTSSQDTSTTSLLPCRFRSVVHYEQREVGQTYFCIALPSLPYADPRRYVVHLLNTVLAGGLSSRLYQQLRETLGLVYYVHSQYYAYRDAGVIMIEGVTSPEALDRVLQTVLLELDQIGQEGLGEDELWKTKMQMKGQQTLAADSLSTRMSRLLTQDFYFRSFLPEDQILESIDAVDGPAVQFEAARMLETCEMGVAVVGPDDRQSGQDQMESLLAQAGIGFPLPAAH